MGSIIHRPSGLSVAQARYAFLNEGHSARIIRFEEHAFFPAVGTVRNGPAIRFQSLYPFAAGQIYSAGLGNYHQSAAFPETLLQFVRLGVQTSLLSWGVYTVPGG